MMNDLWLQILSLVFLLSGLVIGYLLWVRPHENRLDMQGRGLLLLVVLTLMGGFVGSPFWWTNQEQSFSWTLPPLASRMLASAGWSFVVVCFLALRHPTFHRLRLVLILLFVYLAPLALAIFLFHLDRFDPQAPITYAFFAIVFILVGSSAWYLYRQPVILAEDQTSRERSSPLTHHWLTGTAIVTGLWGTALFVTDQGPLPFIWVWPGDLLTSRLISVMLLAIAVGALYSRRSSDPARIMLAMLAIYSLGLALSSLWNAFFGLPVRPAYLVVFGIIGVGSLALLIIERKRHTRPSSSGDLHRV
jgi:hypothetical protein